MTTGANQISSATAPLVAAIVEQITAQDNWALGNAVRKDDDFQLLVSLSQWNENRPDRFRSTVSWLGTREVEVLNGRGEVVDSFPLDRLAEKVWRMTRPVNVNGRELYPQERAACNALILKARNWYVETDQQLAAANGVVRFFEWLRELFTSFPLEEARSFINTSGPTPCLATYSASYSAWKGQPAESQPVLGVELEVVQSLQKLFDTLSPTQKAWILDVLDADQRTALEPDLETVQSLQKLCAMLSSEQKTQFFDILNLDQRMQYFDWLNARASACIARADAVLRAGPASSSSSQLTELDALIEEAGFAKLAELEAK